MSILECTVLDPVVYCCSTVGCPLPASATYFKYGTRATPGINWGLCRDYSSNYVVEREGRSKGGGGLPYVRRELLAHTRPMTHDSTDPRTVDQHVPYNAVPGCCSSLLARLGSFVPSQEHVTWFGTTSNAHIHLI